MLKSAALRLSLPHCLLVVVLACAVGWTHAASNHETTARLTNCGLFLMLTLLATESRGAPIR